MKIKVTRFFEAAHQLPDTPDLLTKACARLHGHTYCAKITAEGSIKDTGMVLDFSGIKEVVDECDHRFLNDLFPNMPTTAENLAQRMKDVIQNRYPQLTNVVVELAEGYKGEATAWVSTV